MDNVTFDNLSFTIDDKYVVKGFNPASKAAFPEIECGANCYKVIRGNSSPCPDCPIFTKDKKGSLIYKSQYNGKKYFATFADLPLGGGKNGYVVSSGTEDPELIQKDAELELFRRKLDIYRQANYYCAYGYFECNLSKDLITTELFEVVDEVEYTIDMSKRGFKKPIKFSDYVGWFYKVKVVSKRDEYKDMTDIEKLKQRFENGEKSVELTFRSRSTSGYLTWHRHSIYMYKDTKSDDLLALYVLRDIAFRLNKDEEVKRNEDIMRVLASEYATVLYVDLETGTVSFSNLPNYIDDEFRNAIKSMKYDDLWKFYIKQRVHNSDDEKLMELLNTDFLKNYFKTQKSYSCIFRVGSEENYSYFELKIVRVEDGEPKTFVIGIADKDEMIRSQQEQQKQLESALILAQKDALTGIRNRMGYDITERRLNADLESGEVTEFALVMFDVNGLKKTNDDFGHENGNLLLKNSCDIICDVYKRSAVFRIGGDEFVAVLLGADYKQRDKLLEKIREIVSKNEEKGAPIYENVSFASGMAVYNPLIDKSVGDVLKRADTLMYENKAKMKARRAELRGEDEDE